MRAFNCYSQNALLLITSRLVQLRSPYPPLSQRSLKRLLSHSNCKLLLDSRKVNSQWKEQQRRCKLKIAQINCMLGHWEAPRECIGCGPWQKGSNANAIGEAGARWESNLKTIRFVAKKPFRSRIDQYQWEWSLRVLMSPTGAVPNNSITKLRPVAQSSRVQGERLSDTIAL